MSRSLGLMLALALPVSAQEASKPRTPLSQEQQDKLKERARFQQEMERLRAESKLPEAISAAEHVLSIERELYGDLHPAVVRSLTKLAELHEGREDYASARKARQELLTLLTKGLGERHWLVTDARLALEAVDRLARMGPADRRRLQEARECNGQAVQCYQRGRVGEALPLARKALEIRREVLGERHLDYAQSLNNLAGLYHAQGQVADAEPLYRQALEVTRQLLGERHPEYANSLSTLGFFYQSHGKYAEAEPPYRQALEVRKQLQGERSLEYAQALNNLAGVYESQGKYREAEPLYGQALQIRKQVLGERHPAYATSLNNFAYLYQSQGKYAEAEPLYLKALEVRKQVQGERHPAYATTLNNLATLYKSQGKYAEAEPLYQKALEITRQVQGERHPDYAFSLNNLAGLYYVQGKYGEAEPLYQKALAITKQLLGEQHPRYAQNLNNLAELYRSQGKYTLAEPLYRQALDIHQQVLKERHPDYASSLNNLAGLYYAQGKYAQAEPLYRQALKNRRELLGEQHPDYAFSLNNLAMLYYSERQYAEAEPLFRQALDVLGQRATAPPVPFEQRTADDLRPLPETVTYLANYAVLAQEQLGPRPTVRQLRAADHLFALALAVRERLRHEVLQQEASKLQHGAYALDLIPRRIGLCQRLFDQEARASDLETAFATAEQGTARLFLEQLGKARALSVGRISPELRQQEAVLQAELRELDTRIALEQDKSQDRRDPDAVGKLLDAHKTVQARLGELVARLEKDYPQYAALRYPRPCSLDEARACLSDNEVALLYVLGDQQSYVILVEAHPAAGDKAHGLAVFPLPGSEELTEGVAGLTAPETLALPVKARALGAEVYALLLGPLLDRIQGKDLVIVPGGGLAYVPFEMLVEEGQYLLERHRIRYAPSLTALHLVRLWEKTRSQPAEPLFAVGDPVYDKGDERLKPSGQRQGSDAEFSRLIHSGREVEAIARLLHVGDGAVLTGAQALEAKIKEASASGVLAQARYVHLATHGILGLDVGQQPALVLSLVGNDGRRDADGGLNDGFLRLEEVTRLQLNADLVVLSACRTAQGRLYGGEGVTGLARAFLYAGSRGVVSSLWSVDDEQTATLMATLYEKLQQRASAADALRAAKLPMIRAGTAPLYWAPFILMGE